MKQNKMREEMISQFLAALQEDIIPWHQEWSAIPQRSFNTVTGRNYRGVNALWLSFVEKLNEYKDPRWCTFKQAKDNGWHVKKGEKGAKVEFWSYYDRETKKTITGREAKELENVLSEEEYKERIKFMVQTYTVFNAGQIEGIPELEIERHEWEAQELLQKREVLLQNMNLRLTEGGERAFYRMKEDCVHMPDVERFENEYAYMSTFLHEAGHATAHESRLNRPIDGSFGSLEYAKEELRAEIASAFTAREIGINYSTDANMENHKAYIQNWISVLESKPEELFAAIRDAEKISNYLLEKGELKQEKKVEKEPDAYKLYTRNEAGQIGILDICYSREQLQERQAFFEKKGYPVNVIPGSYNTTGEFYSLQETDVVPQEMLKPLIELQRQEIIKGVENGIDVAVYARPEYDYRQMLEIREGLEEGLDVSMYASPDFDNYQMNAIRSGLEKGIDVSSYADPTIANYEMTKRLEELTRNRDEQYNWVEALAHAEIELGVPSAERLTEWFGDMGVYEKKLDVSDKQIAERVKEIQSQYVCQYEIRYDDTQRNRKDQVMVVEAFSPEKAFSLLFDTLSNKDVRSGVSLSSFQKGDDFFHCFDGEGNQTAGYDNISIKNFIPLKDQPQMQLNQEQKERMIHSYGC